MEPSEQPVEQPEVLIPPEPMYEEWVSPTRRAFVRLESTHHYASTPGWWRLPWRGTVGQVYDRGYKPTRVNKPLAGLAEA